VLEGSEPRHVARIHHGGALPELARMKINLYVGNVARGPALARLADLIRQSYGAMTSQATAAERDPAAISA